MKALFIGIVLLSTATSVSAKKPLDFGHLHGAYDGVHSHVNHNQRLDFPLPTPTALNALVPLGDVAESIRQGHIVREAFGIDDPTVEVSTTIANEIARKLQLPLTSSRNSEFRGLLVAGLMDPKELASQVGPGKLIVNAGSERWRVYPKGLGGGRYYVGYVVTTEIIDSTQGKLLWRGVCGAPDPVPKKDQLPERSEILENNAAALKSEIAKVRDFCTLKILKDLTGEEPSLGR
jgi:hypothetical protein